MAEVCRRFQEQTISLAHISIAVFDGINEEGKAA
jgi:hypothetical protein